MNTILSAGALRAPRKRAGRATYLSRSREEDGSENRKPHEHSA
jgi:hypothetical protein